MAWLSWGSSVDIRSGGRTIAWRRVCIRWLLARVGDFIGAVRIGILPIAILLPDATAKRFSLPIRHAVRHALHDLCNDISKVAFDADLTYQQGVNEALVVIDIACHYMQHIIHASARGIA